MDASNIRQALRRSPAADTSHFGVAAERLAKVRGEKVTALPPDYGADPMEHLNEAVRDYGFSRFSGETDAIAETSGSYRSSRRRKKNR